MKIFLFLILALSAIPGQAAFPNRVLDLDGDDSFVQLPSFIFTDLEESTIETWVRWRRFGYYSQPFGFGNDWRGLFLNNRTRSSQLQFFIYLQKNDLKLISVPGVLRLDQWCHIAAVSGRQGMKLYLNGVLVGQHDYAGSFAAVASDSLNFLGRANIADNDHFAGQLDEIRVWRVVRSQQQIEADMFARLRGDEPDLVGLWNFDSGDAGDHSLRGNHGVLRGGARCLEAALPTPDQLLRPIIVTGTVVDPQGQPLPAAAIHLEQRGEILIETKADNTGNYWVCIYPGPRSADLVATHGDLGGRMAGVRLQAGARLQQRLQLRPAVDLSGTVLAIDGKPHVAVPVQALLQDDSLTAERVVATSLSGEGGQYSFVNLAPGRYRVRCQLAGSYAYYGTTLHIGHDTPLRNIDFTLASFKRGTWKNFTYLDGLASNAVTAIHQDDSGTFWFGTEGGLSRYDGNTFANFTTRDGLSHNHVRTIYQDQDDSGTLWFGTEGGLSRYDGNTFTNFTTEHGLPNYSIRAILRNTAGILWLGTGEGAARYDGNTFAHLTIGDGLADWGINTMLRDAADLLWLGTGDGLSRYDGNTFTNFTTEHGLANNHLNVLYQDNSGTLWFGTDAGLSRYDGNTFTNFTTRDGLPGNNINAILRDDDGLLWLGTGDGLSRYDGNTFTNFTTRDGLPHNSITALYQDLDGVLWLGARGGISRYGGEYFASLTTRDGLPGNNISALLHDDDGLLWLGTEGGLSRYDGNTFTNFTTEQGMPDNTVNAIYQDPQGTLWIGFTGAIARYDGEQFHNFTGADGLGGQPISAICSTADGTLWLGTRGIGLYRYDGRNFANLIGSESGLANNIIRALTCTPDGALWLGTDAGLSHYDGNTSRTFTTEHGLADNIVDAILRDDDGLLWLGTDAGLSRYDGETFRTFTTEHGLAADGVQTLYRDDDGLLWAGTASGGAAFYDGTAWTSLDTRDGLVGNTVNAILQDRRGDHWLGTNAGLTRYRRSARPPQVHIAGVRTDELYAQLDDLPPIAAGTRVTIAYRALDFGTLPEKQQFRRRLTHADGQPLVNWQITRETTFDHTFKESGKYRFEVIAIDRDLNYSTTSQVHLDVVPPWHLRIWILFPAAGAALLLSSLVYSTRYYRKRREALLLRQEADRLFDQILDHERQARNAIEAKNVELEEAYRQVQRLLRQEERSAVLLRGWAHAVKSPLRITMKELAGAGTQPEREAFSHMEAIQQIVDRLLNAMVDLQCRIFDLKAELELLLYRIAQPYPGVHIEMQEAAVPRIEADYTKLMMAFENIFTNACQVLEDRGGTIILTVEQRSEILHITVKDNGPGIPEEVLSRLLKRTYTTRKDRGGSGLGLLIALHVVEAHGGRIWLESTAGSGTTVQVELPLTPQTPSAPEMRPI